MTKIAQKIKELKDQIKNLEQTNRDLFDDRAKFRDAYANDLKWLIEIHGKRTYPNMTNYIQNKAKFLQTVKKWYW
jgi:hypothetical protein